MSRELASGSSVASVVPIARARSGSSLASRRLPGTVDERRLLVAGPARHRDAQESERHGTGAAVLEQGSDRDVDRDARLEDGRLLARAVSPPDLPLARE